MTSKFSCELTGPRSGLTIKCPVCKRYNGHKKVCSNSAAS